MRCAVPRIIFAFDVLSLAFERTFAEKVRQLQSDVMPRYSHGNKKKRGGSDGATKRMRRVLVARGSVSASFEGIMRS